eukprot:1108956-Ditylum_brightwellii.AAC.1
MVPNILIDSWWSALSFVNGANGACVLRAYIRSFGAHVAASLEDNTGTEAYTWKHFAILATHILPVNGIWNQKH